MSSVIHKCPGHKFQAIFACFLAQIIPPPPFVLISSVEHGMDLGGLLNTTLSYCSRVPTAALKPQQ